MGFRPALLGRVLGPEALLHGHPDEVLERDVTLGVVDENGLTQIEGGRASPVCDSGWLPSQKPANQQVDSSV